MSDSKIFKKVVEVGRAIVIRGGEFGGRLAFIVEIIDHNRALVEGPTTGVPRQVVSYKNVVLTKFVAKFQRGISSPKLKTAIEASGVVDLYNKTEPAKKIAVKQIRMKLSDFELFQVMCLKRQKTIMINRQKKLLKKKN